MHTHALDGHKEHADGYLIGRGQAWFAFAMTIALMLFDYIDRQVIVSLFPYMKADWGLSDKQLGALVSVLSVTVALGALPVALFADRYSRVKSIVVMALIWSAATISCMFSRSYSQLLAARAMIGLGEAGYGSVGAALIASVFPVRMRPVLLAAFFAAASVGSVLGVLLGGLIAARWGWQAAFGLVGIPGLVLALLYLKVRDYRTVELTPQLDRATRSTGSAAKFIVRALVRSPTMLWVCLGGAAQLIVVSAVWAWLPSFLNRVHGLAPDQAAIKAALVVLCGAAGSVIWGALVGRAGAKRPRNKLHAMAALCIAAMLVLMWGFGSMAPASPSQLLDDRARWFCDDLHRGAGRRCRDQCRASRCARDRIFSPGVVSEPIRTCRRTVYRRRAVGRLRPRDGIDADPGVRPAGRLLFHTRCAQLRSRH